VVTSLDKLVDCEVRKIRQLVHCRRLSIKQDGADDHAFAAESERDRSSSR
jgi:hypothetical protein